MKGKDTFTLEEIKKLEELTLLRNRTPPSGQKAVRDKMRKISFYGRDDWNIMDLQLSDLQSLIHSGRIKIIGGLAKPNSDPTIFAKAPTTTPPKELFLALYSSKNINTILGGFKLNRFDPSVDEERKINDCPGNYIICLRNNSHLPETAVAPQLTQFEGLYVVYTGIASGSLRTRDYRQHFKGNNAGRSTLRKSLGVLFGYKQIPRDEDPTTGKTKFSVLDEHKLSSWMQVILIMFFLPTADFDNIEIKLINHFNPPLNLKDNHNIINLDFRRLLSGLRKIKCGLEYIYKDK